tara:strand:- start:126 stop:305 length:180 start_codon:yes stop_codon:yes gene_type:complete
MPWQVIKTGEKFQLKKLTDGTIPNKFFNTKESALNMGLRWMAYRKEKGKIIGNKIIKIT